MRRAYSWSEFLDGLRHGEGTAFVVLGLIVLGIAMARLAWPSTKRRQTRESEAK